MAMTKVDLNTRRFCSFCSILIHSLRLIYNPSFYHGYKDTLHQPKNIDFKEDISYHTFFKKEREMAIHKSAIQQWRRNLRRNAINKKNKSALRKQIRKLRDAIQNKDKDAAQKLLPLTFSLIDKSVKKGTIHENKGKRYKSRLSHQVELITSPPSK
jgi:small subunit ribosomal protein S20